jgi:hypothetical protein
MNSFSARLNGYFLCLVEPDDANLSPDCVCGSSSDRFESGALRALPLFGN